VRYYKRMFLILLIISVSFVGILDFVFLYRNAKDASNAHLSHMDSVFRQLTDYTDMRLETSLQYSAMMRSSEYTNAFLRKTEPVQYNRLRMFRFVSNAFSISTARQNALAVSSLTDDYVVRNDGTGNVAIFLKYFHMSSAQLNALVASFRAGYSAQTQLVAVREPSGLPHYILVRYEPSGHPVPLYIFVSYNEPQLFDTSTLADNGTFVLLSDGMPAATVGGMTLAEVEALDFNHLPSGMEKRVAGSSFQGFSYMFLSYAPGVVTESFVQTLLLGLLALAGAVALAALVAQRMYVPIRELLALTEADAVRDEFEWIKKTISSFHTRMQTMANSFEQHNRQLETAVYRDMLGGIVPAGQFSDTMQGLRLTYSAAFRVAILRFNPETADAALAQDMLYLLKQSIDGFLEAIASACPFFKIIDTSFDTKELIFVSEDISAFKDGLNNALLQIESEHALDFVAAIGGPVRKITEISESHRVAKWLLDMADIFDSGAKVVTQEDFNESKRSTVYFPINLESALAGALAQGKTSAWQKILDEIITTNQNDRDSNLPRLSLMFTACVNRVLDTLQRGQDEVFEPGVNLYLEFREAPTYEVFRQKAHDIFSCLEQQMSTEKKKLNTDSVAKTLQFIEDNYHRDISLFDLADHLGLSKNYMSTLFKNSIGSNFKDYLNSLRYRRAHEILQHKPDAKIKDVAEQVGCSANILTRLFVRYAGMLPSEYQEKLQKAQRNNKKA